MPIGAGGDATTMRDAGDDRRPRLYLWYEDKSWMPAFAGMTGGRHDGLAGVGESIVEASGMTGPRRVHPNDDHAQWSRS
jgi:hypothetical protein